jgi:hypothetical protein
MYRTDDPIADFGRWDDEREKELARLPKCAYCSEPIQDERCYHIDCDFIHFDCMYSYMDKEHLVNVCDHLDEL